MGATAATMPAPDPSRAIPPGEESGPAGGDSVTPAAVPLVPSPPTDAGFQFNQLNVQQIPQTALDKLSSEQLAGLLESALSHSDKLDERRFRFAMDRAEKESSSNKLTTIVGGVIAIGGFSTLAALTYMDNDIVAGIVATFLATIIAVVVGSKLLT